MWLLGVCIYVSSKVGESWVNGSIGEIGGQLLKHSDVVGEGEMIEGDGEIVEWDG